MSDSHESYELNKLEIGELTGWPDTMIEDYRAIGESLNRLFELVNIISNVTSPPVLSTSYGIAGQIASDSSFFYVCVADNTWMRTALATW